MPLAGLGALAMAAALSGCASPPPTIDRAMAQFRQTRQEARTWSVEAITRIKQQDRRIEQRGRMTAAGDRVRAELELNIMGLRENVTIVTDGDGITWIETQPAERFPVVQKMDTRRVLESEEQYDVLAGVVDSLVRFYNLTLNPVVMLEGLYRFAELEPTGAKRYLGQDVRVFQGPVRGGFVSFFTQMGFLMSAETGTRHVRTLIAEETGFPRQIEFIDVNGKSFMTIDYIEVNIDPELPLGTFDYEMPDAATLIDLIELPEIEPNIRLE